MSPLWLHRSQKRLFSGRFTIVFFLLGYIDNWDWSVNNYNLKIGNFAGDVATLLLIKAYRFAKWFARLILSLKFFFNFWHSWFWREFELGLDLLKLGEGGFWFLKLWRNLTCFCAIFTYFCASLTWFCVFRRRKKLLDCSDLCRLPKKQCLSNNSYL